MLLCWKRFTVTLAWTAALLAIPAVADARPVTAHWDSAADPLVAGYRLYFGPSSGFYTNSIDVGNVTSYRFDIPPGITYFIVRAYSHVGIESYPSNEASITLANRPPELVNPGELVIPAGPIAGQLPAFDPDGDPLSYSAAGLPATVTINPATGVLAGYILPGVYTVTVTASDGALSAQVSFRLVVGGGGGGCSGAPGAPALQPAAVAGNVVQLAWNTPGGIQPTAYTLQAGSSAGASNIAIIDLPAATSTLATSAPDGQYFVRVISTNSCGSTVSNEISFRVGAVPFEATVLRFSRAGAVVTLTWTRPPGTPSSYIIEAGSSSGQTNLAAFNTASTQTSFSVSVPSGQYYVRVRATGANGTGAPSNEIVITIP